MSRINEDDFIRFSDPSLLMLSNNSRDPTSYILSEADHDSWKIVDRNLFKQEQRDFLSIFSLPLPSPLSKKIN